MDGLGASLSVPTYQLGQPVALTRELIRDVGMTGRRGKKMEVTFLLKPEAGPDKVVMVLEPLHFKKNKFYPFDLLQEEACGRAMDMAEKLALAACGKTAEELEAGRMKDECGNYATAAGLFGFFGIIAASVSNSLLLTLGLFAVAVAMFGVIVSKKQLPKISVIVVAVEAAAAYFLFRL